MRTTIPLTAAILLLLAGCTAPGAPTEDPAEPGGGPDPGGAATPCIVGTWNLDVPDYAAQSEEYLLGLGLPIEGFDVTGSGTITFTADGLVATEVSLTASGTIVAGDTRVPVSESSTYTGSGDWAEGAESDTIDIENWANVADSDAADDPAAPLPLIDYTDIPTVAASCSASELVLAAPGAPMSPRWTR